MLLTSFHRDKIKYEEIFIIFTSSSHYLISEMRRKRKKKNMSGCQSAAINQHNDGGRGIDDGGDSLYSGTDSVNQGEWFSIEMEMALHCNNFELLLESTIHHTRRIVALQYYGI